MVAAAAVVVVSPAVVGAPPVVVVASTLVVVGAAVVVVAASSPHAATNNAAVAISATNITSTSDRIQRRFITIPPLVVCHFTDMWSPNSWLIPAAHPPLRLFTTPAIDRALLRRRARGRWHPGPDRPGPPVAHSAAPSTSLPAGDERACLNHIGLCAPRPFPPPRVS